MEIWATDLSQQAVCLDEVEAPLPPKLAIVMGTESTGVSLEFLNAAHKRIYLPLRGFADSLNLSVAAALVMQHLFWIDPSIVGKMPVEELKSLRRARYARLARNPEEAKKYELMVETPPKAFVDPRRPDSHRAGWMNRKVKMRMRQRGTRLRPEVLRRFCENEKTLTIKQSNTVVY